MTVWVPDEDQPASSDEMVIISELDDDPIYALLSVLERLLDGVVQQD